MVESNSLSRQAWRRLKKNKVALFGGGLIMLFTFIAVLGYLITPDATPYANRQHLELFTKKPGFKVLMLEIPKNELAKSNNFFKTMLFGKPDSRLFYPAYAYRFEEENIIIEEYTGATPNQGLAKSFNLAKVCYALQQDDIKREGGYLVFTDIEGNYHKETIKVLQAKVIKEHLKVHHFVLGTDQLGRDVLSQLMIGTRVSLAVGLISVFISLLVGITLGAVAGYYRGKMDEVIVWFINVVWSIPTLLLVIAITFALGKGFWQVFIAVGLTMWVEVARVVRGQVISLREKEFIEAAKALGFRQFRIIFRHVLPNVSGAVIVISAANFASAILLEAGLSFLGIGVQPPMSSWGMMIKENYPYIILDSAYLALLPGLCIMLLVLGFMLLGNGLRDALDVKMVEKA